MYLGAGGITATPLVTTETGSTNNPNISWDVYTTLTANQTWNIAAGSGNGTANLPDYYEHFVPYQAINLNNNTLTVTGGGESSTAPTSSTAAAVR